MGFMCVVDVLRTANLRSPLKRDICPTIYFIPDVYGVHVNRREAVSKRSSKGSSQRDDCSPNLHGVLKKCITCIARRTYKPTRSEDGVASHMACLHPLHRHS